MFSQRFPNLQHHPSNSSQRLIIALAFLGLLLSGARPAFAHGGEHKPTLFKEVALGQYQASIWSYPGTLRPGEMELFIDVYEPASGKRVEDVDLTMAVGATAVIDGAPATIRFSPVDEHGVMRYQALAVMPGPGAVDIALQLTDNQGEIWTSSFAIKVLSLAPFQWLIRILLAQAILVGLWLIKEGLHTWGWQPTHKVARRPRTLPSS